MVVEGLSRPARNAVASRWATKKLNPPIRLCDERSAIVKAATKREDGLHDTNVFSFLNWECGKHCKDEARECPSCKQAHVLEEEGFPHEARPNDPHRYQNVAEKYAVAISLVANND